MSFDVGLKKEQSRVVLWLRGEGMKEEGIGECHGFNQPLWTTNVPSGPGGTA
jgi:hypothetical protein